MDNFSAHAKKKKKVKARVKSFLQKSSLTQTIFPKVILQSEVQENKSCYEEVIFSKIVS